MSDVSIFFDRLCVIGIGLIGSSILRASRERGLARSLVAADLSEKVVKRVEELGIADIVTQDLAAAVEGADCVILCVPSGAFGSVAEVIGTHLKAGAVVSDTGSVKGAVVAQMTPFLPPHVHFIPAHPVAGTEYSGPDAGFAALFGNRWCIFTPAEDIDQAKLALYREFWEKLGSKVECMTPEHHDLVLAVTSHVPHLIAYNIVGTADDLETVTESEVIKFSAGGFRDFTRIAASDPTMWRDVFLNNRKAVLEVLGRFSEDLAYLQRAIRWGEGDKLFELFTRTRAVRRSIIDLGQETAEPDFGRKHGK
ncbi:prephenate/arogenate dehydrogenase family protein [Labrys okinawensis]|uniref:prephenate/arogenate dehydrogenase family protein n=1 Tax=Labrys okinawensis TaxID=346911 RepID=UPI0039BCD7B5